ncbi:MAG: transporter substrate-binding protein [Rhodoferax sp.]|nr:transporter substrate-binding protein [Rhodoferax sp.]
MIKRVACIAALCATFLTAARAEPGVTDTTILLGGSNAMTGAVAAVCSPASLGAKAWFDKVNRDGGVHGRKIDYNVLDDAFSAQRAVSNARRLVQQDGVFAIFGGCAGPTSAAILQYVAGQPEVPYLFTWAAMNELTEPTKKNVFALLPNYAFQVKVMLPFSLQRAEPKPKTAGFLMMNVPGAEDMRKAVKEVLAAEGVNLVFDELFEVGVPDYTPYILQLKSKNPDIVLFGDSAAGAAKIFLAMKRQNWHPKSAFGVATLTAEQFLDPIGDYADGWLSAAGMVSPPSAPESKDCNDALKASYPDQKPNHFTMYGCLAAKIGVEAMNRTGRNLTRTGLIASLEQMKNFETRISGPISFSPTDHMGTNAVIPFGTKDGQFVVLGAPLKLAR